MSNPIDISNLDKADVLAALFNNSRQQGLGFMSVGGRTQMTRDQAAEELKRGTDFDYLHGRVMKVNISGDSFSPHLYDRDNGAGAAARAIAGLRAALAA